MTEYTWTIETCEHEVATGGITVAHWRVTAVDAGYSATAYGSCGFTPDATAPGFKPYDQVSQDDVLGWCWGNGVDKAEIEASLTGQINALKNPTSETGVPWA